MLGSHLYLTNCCRVCRNSPDQDDADYECLFQIMDEEFIIDDETLVVNPLSEAGRLYDSLINKITPDSFDYYPRYLCNSCLVQMKLFKKLKDKALNTIKVLNKIYQNELLAREQEKLISEDEENVQISQMALDDGQDTTCYQVMNEKAFINSKAGGNTCPESVLAFPVSMQQPITIANEQLDTNADMGGVPDSQLISEIKNENDSASEAAELAQCVGLDKSDYVLEIYKVLDDGSQSNQITESDGETNQVDVESLKIEEELDTQYEDIDNKKTNANDYEETTLSKIAIPIDEKVKLGTCTDCNEIFMCPKEFKHHKTFIHPQTYTCKMCAIVLKTSRSLATHMKIHDDNPAFSCEICQRSFKQIVHYEYHMNRHNNIKPFSCDQCEKSFISKSELKVHQRRHNKDYRPHVCETCGKSYVTAENLRTHRLKHTDLVFNCDQCSQQFANPKTLWQHVNSIHVSEPRFKCEICMKPFRRKHHLQYHMKLHPNNTADIFLLKQ
ncbi:uncharacterized protein LOC142229282 [Haematobia irritans]|uniref:uncharacterized protein LOC142229282 n=1 Tax=Haematobia irritans TaxID=7368 RepID=UPI003F4FCBC6